MVCNLSVFHKWLSWHCPDIQQNYICQDNTGNEEKLYDSLRQVSW